MHYSAIRKYDVANGPGVRVTLFVSGCDHHCKGCFQPETWNPEYGKSFNEKTEREIIECLCDPQVDGITLLGGDPLYVGNLLSVNVLLCKIRERFGNTKSIWVYTGYRFEELIDIIMESNTSFIRGTYIQMMKNTMKMIDVLVDGRFEEDKKDLRLQFRGSTNQRLIDVPKSMESIGSELKIYHKNRVEDDTYLLDIKECNENGCFD